MQYTTPLPEPSPRPCARHLGMSVRERGWRKERSGERAPVASTCRGGNRLPQPAAGRLPYLLPLVGVDVSPCQGQRAPVSPLGIAGWPLGVCSGPLAIGPASRCRPSPAPRVHTQTHACRRKTPLLPQPGASCGRSWPPRTSTRSCELAEWRGDPVGWEEGGVVCRGACPTPSLVLN